MSSPPLDLHHQIQTYCESLSANQSAADYLPPAALNADDPDAPDVEADEAEPFYGCLEHILILPTLEFGPDFENEMTLNLAYISCCDLPHGDNAHSRVTMFNKYLAPQYIHMGAIGAVVSLVKQGRQLGIID